jgi:hypothetical protein
LQTYHELFLQRGQFTPYDPATLNTPLTNEDMRPGTGSANLGIYSATLTTYRRMQFGLRMDF